MLNEKTTEEGFMSQEEPTNRRLRVNWRIAMISWIVTAMGGYSIIHILYYFQILTVSNFIACLLGFYMGLFVIVLYFLFDMKMRGVR